MSLATTCTNCSTCFRVVQDQLRVSEGWVRCGHCQQVFNALESLFDLDAPHQPVALPPAAPGPGRGVWQTEATARWMRQRSTGNDAPAEREEPLSDDVLAALQAEAAPALPTVDDAPDLPPDDATDDEEDEDDGLPTAPPATVEAPFHTNPPPAEPAPLFAPAPTPAPALVVQPEALLPPPEIAEPAPLDDGVGETAFAPFSAAEERREPVFEATRYEPHGFEDDAVAPPPVPSYPYTGAPSSDVLAEAPLRIVETVPITVAPPHDDEDGGPTSAAMLLTEPTDAPALLPAADEVETAPAPEPEAAEPEPSAAPPAETAPPDAPANATVDPLLPSFLVAAEQRERYRPVARWAFGAVAALLTASLVVQVAWHWRERLAMAWPVMQGPLASLCGVAGCELGAPREINAVVVDNTAVARPPGSSGYRLTVQLHNRATHPVAVPNIDLVLTDAQGAVVARRVLEPADFNYRETALAAQAELQWTAEFTLSEGSLVGYTVAAFYP